MSMEFVRRRYGVPAKRGGRVIVLDSAGNKTDKKGVITSATYSLGVMLDGEKKARRYHPEELYYCS